MGTARSPEELREVFREGRLRILKGECSNPSLPQLVQFYTISSVGLSHSASQETTTGQKLWQQKCELIPPCTHWEASL